MDSETFNNLRGGILHRLERDSEIRRQLQESAKNFANAVREAIGSQSEVVGFHLIDDGSPGAQSVQWQAKGIRFALEFYFRNSATVVCKPRLEFDIIQETGCVKLMSRSDKKTKEVWGHGVISVAQWGSAVCIVDAPLRQYVTEIETKSGWAF